MYYGVSYYPEHKSEEELSHDIELLLASGINTVRMGEFAWCRMEPEPGKYDFDWLLKVVDRLGEGGIRTIICTPTACPPAHLVSAFPDIMYVDNRGVTRPFGGRRHYCYNNENYRRESERIAGEIGRRFGKHPYVLGFQIDNEPAQEGTGRCHCPVCRAKFQNWLKEKYTTIDNLNRQWGTIFWSMEYQTFEQIQPPVNTIEAGAEQAIEKYYENPGLRLEFERFCSESQIEYQNIQANALKRYTAYPVTTNATGLATNSINYYRSFSELSVYAFDYYPNLRGGEIDAYPYAFARGIRGGLPFWVLEFVSGGGHKLNGGGRMQSPPGALKQAALHAFANGAEMLLHFQFRSFPFGAEQLNYAIVDTDGIPRRRYAEMTETAALLKKVEALGKTDFTNRVAVCFDYDSLWALAMKPANAAELEYVGYQKRLYGLLAQRGFGADVISLEDDYAKYSVLIVPTAFVMKRSVQEKLRSYVEQGGILITTFLTSVKNEYNTGYTDSLPAGLTEVCGVTVEEVDPVYGENHTYLRLRGTEERDCQDGIWSELLSGEAEPVAVYIEDYKKGHKVITSHPYGKGRAIYLGTDLPDAELGGLLTDVLTEAGVRGLPFALPKQVQAVVRVAGEESFIFLFNFTGDSVRIPVGTGFVNWFSKESSPEELVLERNGYALLQKNQ